MEKSGKRRVERGSPARVSDFWFQVPDPISGIGVQERVKITSSDYIPFEVPQLQVY